VSIKVDTSVVAPGSDDHVREAWQLKEHIRHEESVLRQRRGFFTDAYRRSRVHLYFADDELVGFAAVRRDGYILFLAVAPAYQGEGFGKQLIAAVAENHRLITCHARTTNEKALEFYKSVGFSVERRIDNYYEDGGDAYYLKLGDEEGLTDKLQRLVSR
jgi:ribosomal protein S18 acetylase RimI-like enzyme